MRCRIAIGLVKSPVPKRKPRNKKLLIRRWHSASCFKQDFIDFYINKGEIDAHEVRAQFKGDLDSRELTCSSLTYKDNSRTVTLPE